MNKITYECPKCGALLSWTGELTTCPVCKDTQPLTDADRPEMPPLTEQEFFGTDEPED